jgi:hypothetical protein
MIDINYITLSYKDMKTGQIIEYQHIIDAKLEMADIERYGNKLIDQIEAKRIHEINLLKKHWEA